jgi:hypothetical protein
MPDSASKTRTASVPLARKDEILSLMAELRVCLERLDGLGAHASAAHLAAAAHELGNLFICEEN